MARETGIHRRPDSRFWWIVQQPSQTASDYVKALGLKAGKKPKHC